MASGCTDCRRREFRFVGSWRGPLALGVDHVHCGLGIMRAPTHRPGKLSGCLNVLRLPVIIRRDFRALGEGGVLVTVSRNSGLGISARRPVKPCPKEDFSKGVCAYAAR